MVSAQEQKRAVGIIRVSQTNGRGGDSFSSPSDQRDHIERLAAEQGWALEVLEPELNVSGNGLLADRPALSRAVMAVQTGSADVIVGAHTERLWWNHETAQQVIRLVEDANGEVWSADAGLLTNRSSADEFSGTVRTAADRLSRRQNAEKSAAAQARAIARGVVPWADVPPGYRRRDDRVLEVVSDVAPVIVQAFELRAAGAPIREVRAFLVEQGVRVTFKQTQSLLASPLYLGEIHFGKHVPNLSAHEAIVERDLWQRVQKMRSPRGRRAKSDQLLARVDVLRCGTCGRRMVAGGNQRGYRHYRCPSKSGDENACPTRVTVGMEKVDELVVEAVKRALSDVEGRAAVEDRARAADVALEQAQTALDGAIASLGAAGLTGEAASVERLSELREARDRAQEHVDHLGTNRQVVTLNAARDWDRLSLDARRALIRATVARVSVAPGRGADRITVELVTE